MSMLCRRKKKSLYSNNDIVSICKMKNNTIRQTYSHKQENMVVCSNYFRGKISRSTKHCVQGDDNNPKNTDASLLGNLNSNQIK